MTRRVTIAKLKQHVMALTQIRPARQFKNIASLNKAARYVEAELRRFGLDVSRQTYLVRGKKVHNIIARVGPKHGSVLVVGAHYDVCGEQAGADDNASGIAGLLEIGRLLAANKPQLKGPVELVAYTLEEPPFFRSKQMGSVVHARRLKSKKIRVRGMLCLEMIGFFTKKPRSQRYPIAAMKWLYPSTGNFIALVSNFKSQLLLSKVYRAMSQVKGLALQRLVAPSMLTGVDFSDHRSYWAENYPAIMLTDTSFYRNPNYHRASDTPDTLDFSTMALVVQGAYQAVLAC